MTKARDLSKLLSTSNGKIAGSNLDVSFENISDTGTEGTKVASGTTAQRGSTAGQLRLNSTTNVVEYYNGSEFKILETPPSIASINKTVIDSNSGTTSSITITGTFFVSGATVLLVPSSGSNISPTSTTFNNATSITSVFTDSDFVNANEPYSVKVINPSGTNTILVNVINVDTSVAWSTSSGSLGNVVSNATGNHFTLSATDSDGDTITYSIQSGSLSTGLSLNSSTGVISGDPDDVTSNTTSNFTVRATTTNANADRSFAITITPPPVSLDYLVVAGGGAGANGGQQWTASGGAGAGGLRSTISATGGGASVETKPSVSVGTVLTITVGGGGAKGSGAWAVGSNGTNSSITGTNSFTTITSIGGGRSPSYGNSTGNSGGSGSGVGQFPGNGTGGAGTSGQGYAGGNTGSQNQDYGVSGSGGGGAGAIGANDNGASGGNGGSGVSNSITGSGINYAGGGAGSGDNGGTGGSGGGGSGGYYNGGNGNNGSTNTGGGGGGTASDSNDGMGQTGGNGGSGVIILRLPTNRYSSTTTGSPTVTTSGSDTILKFNASGSYTV